MTLSVVLATRNEERNLPRCLSAVKSIADEIIIFDEESSDKTVAVAKKFGAKVFVVPHEEIFHKTKQKAVEKATGDWILQLDADEVVTPKLAKEIKKVIASQTGFVESYQLSLPQRELFARHQMVVEKRDGKIGQNSGPYTAFFIPRLNYFLGKFIQHGGVYPDGVIRLVKKGQMHFPAKSVHEQISISGRVGWLQNELLHYAYPNFGQYVTRFDNYTDLEAKEISGSFFKNIFWKPLFDRQQGYFWIYFRHLGFLDGFPGFIWALFSALHFPIAYFKSKNINENRPR